MIDTNEEQTQLKGSLKKCVAAVCGKLIKSFENEFIYFRPLGISDLGRNRVGKRLLDLVGRYHRFICLV